MEIIPIFVGESPLPRELLIYFANFLRTFT
jgi:hypothetical protein